jgi:hypothetical protein
MNSMRFKAGQAGAAWRMPADLIRLAEVCEGARLTIIQAEVARLVACRYTYTQIGAVLSLPYPVARDVALRAEERIRQNQSWVRGALAREIAATITCFRNTFNPKPRAAVFRRIAGGYDTDPVRFRSRLTGEAVDDFLEEPGRLLRTLPLLLLGRSESRSAHDSAVC